MLIMLQVLQKYVRVYVVNFFSNFDRNASMGCCDDHHHYFNSSKTVVIGKVEEPVLQLRTPSTINF